MLRLGFQNHTADGDLEKTTNQANCMMAAKNTWQKQRLYDRTIHLPVSCFLLEGNGVGINAVTSV